jgi:predicted secreted protein
MSSPSLRSLLAVFKPEQQPVPPHDGRGGRFVLVIDCVLNQNVRDQGAASCPAMNLVFLRLCHENGIGIMQMPCPEIAALGLKRQRQPGTSIREALDTPAGRQACCELAASVVGRILALSEQGFMPLAVMGGNPRSPGCAVHQEASALHVESGIFMLALQTELRRHGLDLPFRGLRDASPDWLAEDLQWFRQLSGAIDA